jgi:NTP pyrophosphatase (non-canonical NTP hydrolase)
MTTDMQSFQKAQQRTMRPDEIGDMHPEIAALGLASETGEVCSEIKKAKEQSRPIDRAKVLEEAGDTLWYLSSILSHLALTLDDCAQGNIVKLLRRYPDGFDPAMSLARLDKHNGKVE